MDYQSFQPGGQEQNVAQQVPPILEPSHRHFFNKKFAITLIVLIVAGVSAYAGISWYSQKYLKVPVPSESPNPTADWKTYTNTQYGFEFKYPQTISVDNSFISSIDPKDWKAVINFNTIPHGQDHYGLLVVRTLSVNQLPGDDLIPDNNPRTTVAINGLNWTKVVNDYNYTEYASEHNGLTFDLTIYPQLKISPEQILSTFKFTK